MNRFVKYSFGIITFLASIAGIIGLYIQTQTHNPTITIKKIAVDKLTDLPKVDGLNALYTFKSDTVKSLWRLHYIVVNSGDEIIVGEGNNKNIIRNNIKFNLGTNYKLFDAKCFKQNFPFKSITQGNQLELTFLQWKPEESFELIFYAEQIANSVPPQLRVDDREILNGEVKYSSIYKENVKRSIFENLPNGIKTGIWWFSLILYGLIFILCPILWINEIIKWINFKRWKSKNYDHYKNWVNLMIREKKMTSFKEPSVLPESLWAQFPYAKPPPDSEVKLASIATGIAFIFALIPLLFIIEI